MTFVYAGDDSLFEIDFMRDLWKNDSSTIGSQSGATFPEYVARVLDETANGGNDFSHVCLTRAECARVADRIRASADGGKRSRPRAGARDARGDGAPDLFANDNSKKAKLKNRHVYSILYHGSNCEHKLVSVCASSRKNAYFNAISALELEGVDVLMARVYSVTYGNGNYKQFSTTFSKPY